jgi:predicted nucleic acid-binding protein
VILVDTQIWIDHLRSGDELLATLLEQGRVLMHAFVRGEIALGHLSARQATLDALDRMPRIEVAEDHEVHHLIEKAQLFGCGIGYIDCHLLAAVCLTPGALLLTRDKRLHQAADRLRVAANKIS